ncbi:MAG: hypothetical protein ACYS0I_07845 [Planctomycetota bacterium]|jgi:hypothetical protein
MKTRPQFFLLRLVAETGGQGIYTAERLQQAGFNSGSVLQRALSALMENGFSVYLDAPHPKELGFYDNTTIDVPHRQRPQYITIYKFISVS